MSAFLYLSTPSFCLCIYNIKEGVRMNCFIEKCFENNDPSTVWVPKKRCKCKNRHRFY